MAKTLFYNAKIYSAGKVFRGSFCTEDGWFTDVREEPFPDVTDAAEKVDMEGRFVCPGFNDSHMHLLYLEKIVVIKAQQIWQWFMKLAYGCENIS